MVSSANGLPSLNSPKPCLISWTTCLTGALITWTPSDSEGVTPASAEYNNSFTQFNFGEGFFGTTAAGTQADDNGQGLFAYDVPAGYYALNTKNLEAYG